MPFRASFSCLWCGTAHTVRTPDDLEGWAQLCPDCVGKAGDNGFLRFRLRQALTERSTAARAGAEADAGDRAATAIATPTPTATGPAATTPIPTAAAATPIPTAAATTPISTPTATGPAATPTPTATRPAATTPIPTAAATTPKSTPTATAPAAEAEPIGRPDAATADGATARVGGDSDRSMIDYYEARAPEYDDWYLRRGRYARGAIHDAAWNAELDAAGRWLDALPWRGQIVELAAGTGWWSPLLASRGELSLYDASPAALDRARDRLVAHSLRAHLHVRDAWAEPDRAVDGLFMGFWLSHVPPERLDAFLALAHRWLEPDGLLAAIDSLEDPASGAADHPEAAGGHAVRRLADGREFTIVKVFYDPADLAAALVRAGFRNVEVTTTGRFFLTVSARS